MLYKVPVPVSALAQMDASRPGSQAWLASSALLMALDPTKEHADYLLYRV